MFYSNGDATFIWAPRTGICHWTFEIVPQEVVWSISSNIMKYPFPRCYMAYDILGHDHIQWHPQLIRHYQNLWTYYQIGPNNRFWPYYQFSGCFHETLQRVQLDNSGCGLQNLVLSYLGLAFVLMLRPFSPDLVMFSDFEFWTSLGTSSLTDAYSGHLVLSYFGLAFVLMLIPFSPDLVMFSDFEFRKSLGTSTLIHTLNMFNSNKK